LKEQLWNQFADQIKSGEIEMDATGILKSSLQVTKPWNHQTWLMLVIYAIAILLLFLRVSE
jgi:hypothetical protein